MFLTVSAPGMHASIQMDPGFRIPAVALTWNQDVVSRDVRDLQPVEGWAYPETACRRSSSSKQQRYVK